MLEHDTLGCEPIEIRRARLAVAVRTEMIGAGRVERDEENVRRRRPLRAAGAWQSKRNRCDDGVSQKDRRRCPVAIPSLQPFPPLLPFQPLLPFCSTDRSASW